MPQTVIKSFTRVTDISNKAHLLDYDFSISGYKQYVVWSNEGYDSGVYFRKSTNNGANFDTKIKLSPNQASWKYPKLATIGNNVYVAWTYTDLKNLHGVTFRRSIDGGNTFQNPISLTSTASHLSFSIAAMDNNVYLLWEDG